MSPMPSTTLTAGRSVSRLRRSATSSAAPGTCISPVTRISLPAWRRSGPTSTWRSLPVAGWGPRLPPGHLDAAGAAEAVRRLRPRLAIPIHWGTYKPFYARAHAAQAPGEAFAEHVHALTPNVDVRVLQPGDGLEL